MKKLQILILSCIALVNTTFGQKHCKCDLNQIERRNNDNTPKGRHLDVLTNDSLQHPITTFYRYGKASWFDATKTQSQNLLSLREMFSDYLNNEKTTLGKDRRYLNKLYRAIFNEAFGAIGEYNIENQSESNNAKIAKAAAFVLLVNKNGRGQSLTSDTINILRNKAVSVIKRLEWDKDEKRDEKRKDDYVYRASSFNYSSKHYFLTKTLIMLLQSYDYLKAVYPNDQDVIECGYLLHCYSREIYMRSGNARWSALRRNDNHALMSAGALGLASVVLGDHSAKNIYVTWQPQNWADVAHSRINAVLFDSTGHTRESARGGVYGFGEGTHYFRMAFENLLPFMLAYKNGNPTEQLSITVKGERIEDGLYWKQEKYEIDLETNYMDDGGIANLVEWMYSLTLSNGNYASIDDSYIGQSFSGLCIYRDFKGIHHDNTQIFKADGNNRFVDLRTDIAAVLSEGYIYDIDLNQPNNGYFLDGGNLIHENNVAPLGARLLPSD